MAYLNSHEPPLAQVGAILPDTGREQSFRGATLLKGHRLLPGKSWDDEDSLRTDSSLRSNKWTLHPFMHDDAPGLLALTPWGKAGQNATPRRGCSPSQVYPAESCKTA